ncbi:MAG: hypothetical protein KF805_10970 [Phycisphaeraceae bacterium]|nr:hypothetical protein [Phycisphaeraceae bacterium]
MKPSLTPTEASIPAIIQSLGPIFGPQVGIDFRIRDLEPRAETRGPDYLIRVRWQDSQFDFAAEAKTDNTPRVVDDAVRLARRWSARSGNLPMVIVPYLGEKRIDRLEQELVSGIDLCGNGIIVVPGKMLLRATGKPNRFPERRSENFAYKGKASLVPRVFFRRQSFQSVNEVLAEIRQAGAEISLPTVSKSLAALASDLMIEREDGRISLLMAEALLGRLAEYYTPPQMRRTMRVKFAGTEQQVAERVGDAAGLRLVRAGASSIEKYTAGLRADYPVFYTNDMERLARAIGDLWTPTDRFFDATIMETPDDFAFFDARQKPGGLPEAPALEVFLQLASGHERRDLALAEDVRKRILNDLAKRGD